MTDDPGSLFCPLEFRYGRERVRELFSRDARLARALRVEAALAETEAELGMIPAAAAKEIAEAVRTGRVRLEQVDELEQALIAQGKTYEFHRYEGAGHAFFSTNRPAFRPESALDGWQRIFSWFETYLSEAEA